MDAPPRMVPLSLVVCVAASLFFTRLNCPLLEPEETRYAEIPRQMLAAGHFVEPVWHGEPYYHKPPLLYWLVMASYCLFGVHDWAARLVPALAAVATVLVTFFWGRRLAGPGTGFLGALLLCLSARFVYLGRMLTMDGLLCLWVVVALAAAHLAVCGVALRRRWWLLSAVACGLGLLTKGPVALVLVSVPVLLYRMLDRRGCRPSLRAWAVYLGAALAVAAPWYLAAAARDPDGAAAFFWQHNVRRYVAPLDHAKPFWFYLPGLLVGTLPWSLLLLPLARLLARRDPAEAGRRPPALGFFLLAALWCLLFFSLSGCKRAAYILPALPPLALALGCYLAKLSAPRIPRWRVGLVAAVTFALLFVGVYLLLPGYHRRFALRGQVRRHQELAADARVAVGCYPHRWDSVSFYLRREDVRTYTPGRRAEMVAELRARPVTLLFVKSDRSLEELRRALPPELEFVPCGRHGSVVTAGIVRSNPRVAPRGLPR